VTNDSLAAAPSSPPEPTTEPATSRRRRGLERIGPFGVPIAGLLLVVTFTILAEDFATVDNAQAIVREAALPALVAAGLTVVLATGDFDLSIAAVAGFSTMLLAVLLSQQGLPYLIALAIVIAIAVGVGILNGTIVSYFGIDALVATLAMGSLLNGLEFAVSDSTEISGGYPQWVLDVARGEVGPVPTLAIIAGLIIIAIWVMLERTALGREMRAVGSNSDAARLAGVDVRRTRLIAFVVAAVAACVAGSLYGSRQGLAYPLTGLNVLLPSYAAAFIGAAMFRLGQFNIPGTIVGVFIAVIASIGLTLMDVPSYTTYIFQGAILLAALGFARVVGGGASR
jgi:ribose transport system permease protein